jgi:hypothetical protein
VAYTIQPRAGLPTGTTISGGASIVFDVNAPLATNQTRNTLDAGNPTSRVADLPAITTTADFPVNWSGSDDASGIGYYNVFVSDNGGPFTPWQTGTTDTSATCHGAFGHTYAFFSEALDSVGHIQTAPKTAGMATTMLVAPPTSSVLPLPAIAPSPTFTVSWSGSPGTGADGIASYDIFVATDGGPLQTWLTATMATSATFNGQPGHTYGFASRATDNVGNTQAILMTAQATTTVEAQQAQAVLHLSGLVYTYDGTAHTATLSTDPAGLGGVSVTYTRNNVAVAAPTAAGSYAVVAALSNPAYTAATVTGTLTINPAPLTFTADDASKVEGQPNPAFTAHYAGFVPGEGPAALGGSLSFTTPADSASPAGSYPITPGGLSAANYAIRYVNGSLTVTPAPTPPPPVRVLGVAWQTRKLSKKKSVQNLVVSFSGALEPGAAQNLADYHLATLVKKKKGVTQGKPMALASATYDSSAHTVALVPRGKVSKQVMQLTINAAGTPDSLGRPIDGNRDGQPGGDFQMTFGVGGIRLATIPRPSLARRVSAEAVDALLVANRDPAIRGRWPGP